MKKWISAALALVLSLSLVACGGDTTGGDSAQVSWEDQLGSKGVIRVGISPDYEPFESYDENGNIVGFDVDMVNELASYLGVDGEAYKIELIPLDFQTIISALNVGQVDIGVSCFTYDPERDCQFTDPYLESSQVVVIAEDGGVNSLADLANTTIAAGMNTTGYDVAEQIASEQEGVKVISPGSGYPVMFESLKSGAIKAVVCDKAVGQNYVDNNPGVFGLLPDEFEVENTCIVVKNGNDALYTAVNDAVKQFNESQTKADLLEKYGL